MERIRLTKRYAKNVKADSANPETAIDLGKDRTYHKIDEYHTFEQTVNHELPDMRHEWKDNPRTETGHGIPKMAKVYIAAKKATKLAMMFLGDKAGQEKIEKQAKAFMRMGDKALTASINLWAECKGQDCEIETTNASDDEIKLGAEEESVKEEKEAPVKEQEVKEEKEAPVKEEETSSEEQEVKEEAPAKEEKEASQEVTTDIEVDQTADDADIEVDQTADDADIEFDDVSDTDDVAASKDLEACFGQEADDDAEETVICQGQQSVSRKAGVKKLAGQPTLVRVASKKADELAGLWDKWSNPDIR